MFRSASLGAYLLLEEVGRYVPVVGPGAEAVGQCALAAEVFGGIRWLALICFLCGFQSNELVVIGKRQDQPVEHVMRVLLYMAGETMPCSP